MSDQKGYEERYCLFLDILGFQSHIDESVDPKAEKGKGMTFSRLKCALDAISEGVHYRESIEESGIQKASSRRVTQFSDSVVISYLKDEMGGHGVGSIILDVHRLQLNLIGWGVLLRGAITSGLLYHDEKLVFGPALNEVVALEKLANYPRVILDGQLLDEAGLKRFSNQEIGQDYSRSISSMAIEDFDGLFYIDYLNVHPDDFGEDWEEFRNYLEDLRRIVKGLANKKSPSIKVKHSWLRAKFNAMTKRLHKDNCKYISNHSVPEDEVVSFLEIKPF